MSDVCISVPTVVGRGGVQAQLEIELWSKEVSALQQSARVLRETIDMVLQKNPNAAKAAAGRNGRASTPARGAVQPILPPLSNGKAVQVTMGGGGSSAASGRPRVTISGQTGGGRSGY